MNRLANNEKEKRFNELCLKIHLLHWLKYQNDRRKVLFHPFQTRPFLNKSAPVLLLCVTGVSSPYVRYIIHQFQSLLLLHCLLPLPLLWALIRINRHPQNLSDSLGRRHTLPLRSLAFLAPNPRIVKFIIRSAPKDHFPFILFSFFFPRIFPSRWFQKNFAWKNPSRHLVNRKKKNRPLEALSRRAPPKTQQRAQRRRRESSAFPSNYSNRQLLFNVRWVWTRF